MYGRDWTRCVNAPAFRLYLMKYFLGALFVSEEDGSIGREHSFHHHPPPHSPHGGPRGHRPSFPTPDGHFTIQGDDITPDMAVLRPLRETLFQHIHLIHRAFDYYAILGSGDFFSIQQNAFTTFIRNCNFPLAR